MSRLALCFAVVLALGGGCSKSNGRSVVTGRVDLTTMDTSHVAAIAIDRRGHALVAPVAADGTFRLSLPARATYHIVLRNLDTRAQVPMVFQRTTGTQTTLRVRGASAVARNLGTVRLLDKGVSILTVTGGGNDQCMDGKDPAGQPCVDDNAENEGGSCGADEEDSSKDNDNVDDQNGDSAGDTSGGGDTSTTQVAVPSVTPPSEVGSCGNDDGDNVEDQSGDQSGQ